MRAFLVGLALLLIRVYYRSIAVSGSLPADGPVIVVANHPNGLLDPAVIRAAVGRPVAFLAKHTLFEVPLLRTWLTSFGAIPVYRAKEADTSRNAETFERCDALLRAGGWLALFPEGISHSEPDLQPLKTGAARIALRARGVRIVPVGLLYEDKAIFRSRVSVRVGAPIAIREADDVAGLTRRIADTLADVVLEADDPAVWAGLVAVATWTGGGGDIAATHARARELAAGYRRLAVERPEALESLVADTRRLVATLDAVGVSDPLALETRVTPRGFVRGLGPLFLLAPIALVGALLGWIPYRLVRPLAHRLARGHDDVIGTYKLLSGMVLIGGWWAAQAVAVGAWAGPWLGLAAALLAPATGFVALRWEERRVRRSELARAGWLVLTRARLAEAVAERRRDLARRIDEALG